LGDFLKNSSGRPAYNRSLLCGFSGLLKRSTLSGKNVSADEDVDDDDDVDDDVDDDDDVGNGCLA
jgi:hypothetical protein